MIRVIGALCLAATLVVSGFTHDLRAVEPEAPIHHDADVRLDPESRRLSVVDVITLRGRKEFRFHLAPWLEIESMLLDGRAIAVPARADARRTTLPDEGSGPRAVICSRARAGFR